jgi:DNA-binding transcriptional regulator LsrR (DeoR family)
MPRPRSSHDLYLLSKVSSLYYLRGQTQQEIADRLHLSRPKVSRLLQEAQARGIVQITVAPPQGLHMEVEERLEECYGLSEAQVVHVEPGQSVELVRRDLGAAAAAYLARTVQPGESIGIAWGTTLSAMVQALSPLRVEGVRVVQTLGGLGPPEADAYAAELVRRLAQLLGASASLLSTPAVMGTAAAREVLQNEPQVQAALRQLDALDVVFVGIGSLRSNPVLNSERYLPRGLRAELEAAGAVGDVALHFFNAEGSFVRTSLDELVLGIGARQLQDARRVVAVAGGPDKVDAIAAALRTATIDVLITDQVTAGALTGAQASEHSRP